MDTETEHQLLDAALANAPQLGITVEFERGEVRIHGRQPDA